MSIKRTIHQDGRYKEDVSAQQCRSSVHDSCITVILFYRFMWNICVYLCLFLRLEGCREGNSKYLLIPAHSLQFTGFGPLSMHQIWTIEKCLWLIHRWWRHETFRLYLNWGTPLDPTLVFCKWNSFWKYKNWSWIFSMFRKKNKFRSKSASFWKFIPLSICWLLTQSINILKLLENRNK